MRKLFEATARLFVLGQWTAPFICCFLLSGCTAADGGLELVRGADTDEALAEAVADDPFPSAAELGVASAAK